MPPKRNAKKPAPKAKATASARAPASTKKESAASSKRTSTAAAAARTTRATTSKPPAKGKAVPVAKRPAARGRASTAKKATSQSTACTKPGSATSKNTKKNHSRSYGSEQPNEHEKKEEGTVSQSLNSSSSSLEFSDSSSSSSSSADGDSGDVVHSVSEAASRPSPAHESSPPQGEGESEARICTPPSQAHRTGDLSNDKSPAVLTADSEGKRSSLRWQHHFATGGDTQHLRDEDDAFTDRTPPRSELHDPGVDAHDREEAVKQLFARPPRAISYSVSSSNESTSSSSSFDFIDDAADRTLPMNEDEENSRETRRERTGEQEGGRRRMKRGDVGSSRTTPPPRPSAAGNTPEVVNLTHSPHTPTSSAGTGAPPPLMPDADTPRPAPSLSLQAAPHITEKPTTTSTATPSSAVTTMLKHNPALMAALKLGVKKEHDTRVAAVTAESSADTSSFLLHGSTTFSLAPAWSSSSDAPLLPDRSSVEDSLPPHDAQEKREHHHFSPSPQPHPVGGSTSFTTSHVSYSASPSQQPQQQQHPPPPSSSTGGHLRMGGNSASRTRSPSLTHTPARHSHGWLKKVNAGAAAEMMTTSGEHVVRPRPLQLPVTAGVFPANPLSVHEVNTVSLGASREQTSAQFYTPPTQPLHAAAAAVEAQSDRSSGHSIGRSGNRSPLRMRQQQQQQQREPPVWRSPQPAQVPKSLNVSPSSVACPPASSSIRSGNVNAAGRTKLQREDDTKAARASMESSSSQTNVLPSNTTTTLFFSAASYPSATSLVVGGPHVRSRSNSSTSTAVLTQTYSQMSAASTPETTQGGGGGNGHASRATSSTAAPAVGYVSGSPGQSMAPSSRPSTQLINKAAATRPTASPATMWICLDDDDDDDDDEENDEERGEEEDEEMKDEEEKITHADQSGRVRNKPTGDVHDGQQDSKSLNAELYSRNKEDVLAGKAPASLQPQQQQQVRKSSPGRRRPVEKSHPIAEILSPTFRPRRRPTQELAALSHSDDDHEAVHAHGDEEKRRTTASTSRPPQSQQQQRYYIQLDDSESEDEEREQDGAPPWKRARVSSPPSPSAFTGASPIASATTATQSPSRTAQVSSPAVSTPGPLRIVSTRTSAPLILDDDSSSGGDENEEKTKPANTRGKDGRASAIAREDGVSEDEESVFKSPLKPTVKDLFFPKRLDPEVRPCSPLYESIHAYQQQYQQHKDAMDAQESRGDDGDATPAAPVAPNRRNLYSAFTAAIPDDDDDGGGESAPHKKRQQQQQQQQQSSRVPPAETAGHKRSRAQAAAEAPVAKKPATKISAGKPASLVPALPDWGRPADTLLRDFFPTKFTKKSFMEAAQKVMSPLHFLDPNDFWEAFTSAEFVGEGSFGLVWRCRTADGDLVAVKSCPIILRTKANIEDSFSTIREIATMRFLNEMQVPYVLPLHSAFFVKASEALPPLAQEALEWRQRLRKTAETAVLAEEVKLLGRGQHQLSKRGGKARAHLPPPAKEPPARGKHNAAAAKTEEAGKEEAETQVPLTFEERVAAQLARQAAAETAAEKATRARLQHVRLPRFLSITEDDLRQSDATAFLVMELCDGDVEGIPRSDGVAKGVVYCVSSALAAMHELGLVHLDLKPSNVLFAYEHGPSQKPFSTSPSSSLTTLHNTNSTNTAADAVKFYLSDFGNCRLVGPEKLDMVEDAYGTFEYMDLRALQDAVCGRPTDAFSLGAMLYELLYGRRLYPKCHNPKCAADDDHTRACFVEAAKRPVVALPALPTAASVNGNSDGGGGPPFQARGVGSTRNSSSDKYCSTTTAKSLNGSEGKAGVVTPLQYLTLALLQKKWVDRMTAAECRRYLIDAFNITQAEEEGGGEDNVDSDEESVREAPQ